MSDLITKKIRTAFYELWCKSTPSIKLDRFLKLCDDIDAKYEDMERKLENSIQLPVDDEDIPIRLGDEMVNPSTHDAHTVAGVGSRCFFTWNEKRQCYNSYGTGYWKHYKPDSWDLIIHDAVCGGDEDELIARCKALAGEVG